MSPPSHRFRDIERTAEYLQPEKCMPPPVDNSMDKVWFIKDGCGIACAVVTWLLIFYAEFVVIFVMLLPSKDPIYSTINGILFNILAFMALASHFRAMITDPVSRDAMELQVYLLLNTVWLNKWFDFRSVHILNKIYFERKQKNNFFLSGSRSVTQKCWEKLCRQLFFSWNIFPNELGFSSLRQLRVWWKVVLSCLYGCTVIWQVVNTWHMTHFYITISRWYRLGET